ncbi:flagellar motor protein MotB [Reinekea thalattae]|uniref:OmpA family protein n=1 Tax=Reinekea thalattae TaxID=2593301 RepID=A0A5C8ZBL5_9GAMM|nr:flagellar motor protein MotB [Reinekea thalattae]TXR54286.1 OmpA family protein [Reinekea thalattae]
MDEEEDDNCPECVPGLPAWMGTFSDLMALLMCFFILLLSFSEMDALKFKRLAGSLRQAFGVQAELELQQVPKGTSIIAKEFSPAKPEPTPLNVIRQDTMPQVKDTLEVMCQDTFTMQETQQGDTGQLTRQIIVPDETQQEQLDEQAQRIGEALSEPIADGLLQVETLDDTIIIRIKEQSFGAGSDYVADEFLPILDIIRDLLVTTPGDIYVEGHTDSLPISTARFRNNWMLSSARALAVAEYLFIAPEMDENRFTVVGHGSSQPMADNTTAAGRLENRRVEIVIKKPNPNFPSYEVEPEPEELVDPGDTSLFELDPEEIF